MPDRDSKTVTAALVIIGNEVLSGRTRDANLQYLGDELNKLGIRTMEARVIPDIEGEIIEAVNLLRAKFDYVFTTGGIGPTHDDITSAAIARAFGIGHHRDPEAEAILRTHYKAEDITEARLKMAEVPVGAELLDNPVSKAPGFRVENVYVLPGVPRIMQAIFEGFRHSLAGGQPMLSVSISSDVQEGQVGRELGELQACYPNAEIGSYPYVKGGKTGTSLVARSTDQVELDEIADKIRDLVRRHNEIPLE